MAGKTGGYMLPEVTAPDEFICVQIQVPTEVYHQAAFWGAMDSLGRWFNWQRDEQKRGKDVAAFWRGIVDAAKESTCEAGPMEFTLQQQNCDIVLLVNGFEATRLTLDTTLCPSFVGPQGPPGPQGPQGIPGEDGQDGIAGDYIQDIQLVDGVIRKRNQDGDISDVVDLCVDNCNWSCEWIFAAVSELKPWQLVQGFWDSALKSQFYDDGLGVWIVQLYADLPFNGTFNVSHIEVDIFVPDGQTDSPWQIIIAQYGGSTVYYENQPGIAFNQPMQFTVKVDVDEADQFMDGLTIAIEQEFTDNQVDDHIDIWIEAIRIVGTHPKARYDDGAIDRLICPDS